MFLPERVFELLTVNRDQADSNRQILAAAAAERDSLKLQLATANNQLDWFRVRVNQLEYERAALMEKAYNIKIPVPEIATHSSSIQHPLELTSAIFEDLGDRAAKDLGLPSYT